VRVPQLRASLYTFAAVLTLAVVAIAFVGHPGHHRVSAGFRLGLIVVVAIFAYPRRTVAVDPHDYRVRVRRLGLWFGGCLALWGTSLLVLGRLGHRGQLDAGSILAIASFFAVSLALLALSMFWSTPRNQQRLRLLRERAEAKQGKIAAEDPPEPAESAHWDSPPYFGK
jgi:hypothetical protein